MNPILLFVIVTTVGSIAASISAVAFNKARGLNNHDAVGYSVTMLIAGIVTVAINRVYFDHHHAASVVSMVIQITVTIAVLILNRRSTASAVAWVVDRIFG
jgi:hypothetical protein